jgi:hypothetical protein
MLRIVRDQSLSESLPPGVLRLPTHGERINEAVFLAIARSTMLHDSSERDFETVFADLAPIASRRS